MTAFPYWLIYALLSAVFAALTAIFAKAGLTRSNWLFLVLSAVATGLSWLFYYRALQLGKVSEVSVIDKGSILFTILLSFLFLREPLTGRVVIASLLITGGMMVLIWR